MSDHRLIRNQVIKHKRQRLYGEIVLSDNRISSRTVVVVGIICLAATGWATTATYPRTEAVSGVVVTSGPSAKIFAPRTGVAERVFVHEEAVVRRGQRLAFIAVDVRNAFRRGAADESLVALDRQTDNLQTRLSVSEEVIGSEAGRLQQALTSNAAERASLGRQRDIQAGIVASKTEELERLEPVVDKGFVSRFEFDRRRQSLMAESQRLEQIVQQLVQLDSRRDELTVQLRRLPSDQRSRRAEFQEQLNAIALQQSRAKVEVGYSIVAPIDGRVTALQVAPGRNIDPRLPVMVIVPKTGDFRIRLFATSKAVGFLRSGQPVNISFDAFPYKQFGTFKGEIVSVSHSAYSPNEIDAPVGTDQAVYPIEVRLNGRIVSAGGRPLLLQAGMTLSANVILERRSFLDWLLQPLNAVKKRI